MRSEMTVPALTNASERCFGVLGEREHPPMRTHIARGIGDAGYMHPPVLSSVALLIPHANWTNTLLHDRERSRPLSCRILRHLAEIDNKTTRALRRA